MPHKFTHQNSSESPCVISQLRKEINDLKKELASKQKRSTNVLNCIIGEKDKEISDLKMTVNELNKELQQEKDRSEQLELLRLQLESATKQSEYDQESAPAEEVPIGNFDDESQCHRSVSQV